MREKTRRTRRVRWLAALLGAFVFVLSVMPVTAWAAPEANSLDEVYVSSTGNDKTGIGSEDRPLASLAAAVTAAAPGTKDNPTRIVVMDNITVTESARFWSKHIVLTSGDAGVSTVTRAQADDFLSTTLDQPRGGYNGALIECGNDSTLRLENIVFDDDGNHNGKHYVQTYAGDNAEKRVNIGTEENPIWIYNTEMVQDGILATFDVNTTITLGPGAVLRNYGGMSAVRLSSGTLVMESGSEICDTKAVSREKGHANDYGFAGAVWIQGGSVTVDRGASIHDTSGHAIYADGDATKVYISGDLHDIVGSSGAWQGQNGIALHLRGGATAVLSGRIDDISRGAGSGDVSAVYVNGVLDSKTSSLTMEAGSQLTDGLNNMIGIQLAGSSGGAYVYMNGKISGCTNSAIHMNGSDSSVPNEDILHCVIGPNGTVQDNHGGYGNVTMQTQDGILEVYGKIKNNTSSDHSGICMAHNMGRTTVVLHDGCEVSGNYSSGGVAGINARLGAVEIEDGAVIADNIGVEGAGIFVSEGCNLTMNGGTISGNKSAIESAGLTVELSDYKGSCPTAQLVSGTITDNWRNSDVVVSEDGTTVSATGGEASSVVVCGDGTKFGYSDRYLSISAGLSVDEKNILFTRYDFDLVDPDRDVKFGNASTSAEDAAKGALASQNLTTVVGSFWFQSGDAVEDFTLTAPQKTGAGGALIYNDSKPVYAAIVAVDEDGLASSDAEVRLMPTTVNDDGTISLTVPSGPANGYGVVLVQESPEQPANVVSVTPADMTVYMGGNGGYKAVVDENGKAVSSNNSLPEPLFRVKLPDGVNADELTFFNDVNSWTLSGVGGDLYTFVPVQGQGAAVRVQYSDGATVVKSDEFEPTSEVYNELAISIYAGEQGSGTKATYGGSEYAIAQGVGRLTVRAVSDTPVVNKIQSTAPSAEELATSGAIAFAPADTTYTLNDTDVELPAGAKPSLLFDDIIDDNTTDRTALLNARIAKVDGIADGFKSQIKYLDLVDANNGNAWIAASDGVDVYWAYPEGVTASDGVKVLHFENLHRSGPASGFDAADIANATVSEVKDVQRVPGGIKLHVGKASFSPFAIVWDYDNGGGNQGGGGGTSTRYYEITATAGEGGSISPSGTVSVREGADRTFTVKPDEGWTVGDVVVDGVSYRQLGSYTFEDVRADHTISVTFMRGSDPLSPDDTGVSDWLETDEHVAYLHGYGDGSGKFGPENPMTRAEVAQMFYNLLLDKSMGDRPVSFEDVPEGAYYAEAVITLASRGILNGTGPATYEPDRPITRAEFVAIAMRFSSGEFEGENTFVDVPEDAWYRDYVVGATSFGWIYGYQDGSHRFGPDDTITRGQATMVTNRMLGRVADGAWIVGHLGDVRTFSDLPQGHYAFFDVVEATNAHEYERVGDTRFEDWTGLRE